MSEQIQTRRRKLPVGAKLLFASGALQEAAVTAGGIVTIIFYNQVLGVSPALAGTAFLIASIVDAISDPLIGSISDRFRSAWGRRLPFMFASALPIAVSFYFLYQPVEGLSETGYFIWLVTFLILLRLSQTFYLIPHDALGAELTDDYEERSLIFGYNSVAVSLLSILTASVVSLVILPTTPGVDHGFLNEAGYFVLAATGSITIFFSVMLCSLGMIHQLPYLHDQHYQLDLNKVLSFRAYLVQFVALFRNISYLATCISLLILYVGLGIIAVVATYAYIYVYELSAEAITWASIAKTPGVFIALPLLVFLSKRMEKKSIIIISTVIMSLMIALPHNLRLLDLFPANDSTFILVGLFVPLFLGYMLFPVSAIVLDSQLADIADQHELNTGYRSEGIIFSARSFGIKSTTGIGGFIAGFGLEHIGFPENAEVGALMQETITGLLVLNGPVYMCIYLIAAGCMAFYQLDRNSHNQLLRELESRRGDREEIYASPGQRDSWVDRWNPFKKGS